MKKYQNLKMQDFSNMSAQDLSIYVQELLGFIESLSSKFDVSATKLTEDEFNLMREAKIKGDSNLLEKHYKAAIGVRLAKCKEKADLFQKGHYMGKRFNRERSAIPMAVCNEYVGFILEKMEAMA